MLFREGMKHEIVMRSNALSLMGLGVLVIAMTSAVSLIAHIVYGEGTAIVTGACTGLLFVSLWYVLPLGTKHLSSWDDD